MEGKNDILASKPFIEQLPPISALMSIGGAVPGMRCVRASLIGALSSIVSKKVTDLVRGRKLMLQQVLQLAL
jgi:hypothetical protein